MTSIRTFALFALSLFGLLAACSERPHLDFDDPTVRIRIVSDYVAGIETTRAEVIVRDSGGRVIVRADRPILRSASLLDGIEVAAFDNVPPGTYSIVGALKREDGTTLGSATLTARLEGGGVHTLYILSSCEGVECGEGTVCLQGTCVDPECSLADPTKCPPDFFCEGDDDCASEQDSCAVARCVARACVSVPIAGRCGDTEYCAREDGCAPIDMPGMPTGPDPRCGTVCRVPEEPCRYGYYACTTNDDGSTTLVCTPFTTRPTGAPCGSGTVCNEAAECVEAPDGGLDGGSETLADAGDVFDAGIISRDAAMPLDMRVVPDATTNVCVPNPCGPGRCTPSDRARAGYVCACPDGYEPTVLTCVPVVTPDAGVDAAIDASVLSFGSRLISFSGVEGGAPFVYEFSLSDAPTAAVRFEFTPRSGDLESSPTFIEFTPSDWSPRTVNFEIVDDTIIEGQEQVFVDFAVVSTDLRIGGVTGDIEMRVDDNDFPSNLRVVNGVPGLSELLVARFDERTATTTTGFPGRSEYRVVRADVLATLTITLDGELTPIVAPVDVSLDEDSHYTAFVYEDLVVPPGCVGDCDPEITLQMLLINDDYNEIPSSTFRARFGQFAYGVDAPMRVTGALIADPGTPIEFVAPHAALAPARFFPAPGQYNFSFDVNDDGSLESFGFGIGFGVGHQDIFIIREPGLVRMILLTRTSIGAPHTFPFAG